MSPEELLSAHPPVAEATAALVAVRGRRDAASEDLVNWRFDLERARVQLKEAIADGDPTGNVRDQSAKVRMMEGELEDLEAALSAQEQALKGAEIRRFLARMEGAVEVWRAHAGEVDDLVHELTGALLQADEVAGRLLELDQVWAGLNERAQGMRSMLQRSGEHPPGPYLPRTDIVAGLREGVLRDVIKKIRQLAETLTTKVAA